MDLPIFYDQAGMQIHNFGTPPGAVSDHRSATGQGFYVDCREIIGISGVHKDICGGIQLSQFLT